MPWRSLPEQGGKIEAQLPKGYRWQDLEQKEGIEQLNFYRSQLPHLGTEARSTRVKAIFADAQTSLRQPRNLARLVEDIDKLDWFSAKEEGLGDLYEACSSATPVRRIAPAVPARLKARAAQRAAPSPS